MSVESMFSAPHYYLKSTVRMEQALSARQQLNSELPERVGFNAFLIKFVAEALKMSRSTLYAKANITFSELPDSSNRPL